MRSSAQEASARESALRVLPFQRSMPPIACRRLRIRNFAHIGENEDEDVPLLVEVVVGHLHGRDVRAFHPKSRERRAVARREELPPRLVLAGEGIKKTVLHLL